MAIDDRKPAVDSEDIALSSSELDDILNSADVTREEAESEEEALDKYGVWVKVKPEEVPAPGGDFELSDLSAAGGMDLTAEEEDLLGELEQDASPGIEEDLRKLEEEAAEPEVGPGGLDLDELGTGQPEGEDLSVPDLEMDLEELSEDEETPILGEAEEEELTLPSEEELGEEAFAGEELPEMEDLPDMETPGEVEVPLSERTPVEDNFDDLGALEEELAEVDRKGPSGSMDVLQRIERDLAQIRADIQNLKSELSGLGRAVGTSQGDQLQVEPAPPPGGFFAEEEDETIALTGDELDNILNTADITEEVTEGGTGQQPESGLEDLGASLEPAAAEEEILAPGSLDLSAPEAPQAAEEEVPEIEISLGEEEPGEGGGLASLEEPEELSLEEPEELSLEEPEELSLEEVEELSLEEAEEPSLEEVEELSLEEAEEPSLEEVEELSLEEAEEPSLEEVEELSLDEAEEPSLEEVEELSLEEAEEPSLEEVEELSLEEPVEELEVDTGAELETEESALEEPSDELELTLEEDAAAVEPSATELTGEEEALLETSPELEEERPVSDLPDTEEDLAAGQLEAGAALPDELGPEALEATEEESAELPAADLEEMEEGELAPLEQEEGALGGNGKSVPEDLKADIKSVLSYLDQLLEALPEEKIREFANSEYFGIYKKLFEELGLEA